MVESQTQCKKLAKEFAIDAHAEEYECPYCLSIGPSPWFVCEECGVPYCATCLEFLELKEDQPCLKCHVLTKKNSLKNMPALNRIKFHCINRDKKCAVTGTFKEMILHVQTCDPYCK